jgi:ribonuclease HI
MKATIHIDGASRGNPGPGAYAYIISRPGQPDIAQKGVLGNTTNNVAEYTALLRSLEAAAQLGVKQLTIFSDSELLVKQMKGQYKVKNPALNRLFIDAKNLTRQFDQVALQHVPREQNKRADQLCNEALDGAVKPARVSSAQLQAAGHIQPAPQLAAARNEAMLCLQAAAAAWANGNPNNPAVDVVWDQLWSILEENNLVRSSKKK